MTLKEQMAQDIRTTFLNLDEFATEHMVEGKKIKCVMDEDEFRERNHGAEFATAESGVTLHAAVEDLPDRREPYQSLNIDGLEYTILLWQVNFGMAMIDLTLGIE